MACRPRKKITLILSFKTKFNHFLSQDFNKILTDQANPDFGGYVSVGVKMFLDSFRVTEIIVGLVATFYRQNLGEA